MKNLVNDLNLINEIVKYEVETDWDSESILYIAVDFEKAKDLIKEFLEGNKHYSYDEYLKDYLEDNTIDICGLWGEIDVIYKIDTWYNNKKKEFYIVKWYHRVRAYYSNKKRQVKYKLSDLKSKNYRWRVERKYNKEQKKRLKELAKIYKNQKYGM